jgi:hypothetical protein
MEGWDMRRLMFGAVYLAVCLGVMLGGRPAEAQTRKTSKGETVKLTADELAKECEADPNKAEAKYKGKMLRVTGVVGSVYDEILYLPSKKSGGGTTDVVIRYGKENKPAVKTGEKATFEGHFDRVAVLGPALTECKLIQGDDEKGKK